ncbi:type II toxin-antitoxin system TacA family antitoxin [Methylosinus sp. LW4]|uniref:type II toxin-antitoxin system TacA family antitoxin n=1 Tax=Methylosinus sp. LW4 TaxID=136993 RepID=UPI001FD8A152|nr:DUF1778 domain-containing protein [Methylosinus sp. LW4]
MRGGGTPLYLKTLSQPNRSTRNSSVASQSSQANIRSRIVRGFSSDIAVAKPPARIEISSLYAIVIRMKEQSTATSVLSVRVSPDERALLEEAAAQSRMTLSEFMRRKAVEAAEAEVIERSVVTILAKDWEAFEAWLDRPAEPIAALSALAQRTPSWKK